MKTQPVIARSVSDVAIQILKAGLLRFARNDVFLVVLLCSFISPALAQQQPMRDYSLSPADTLKQPNITHSPAGIGGYENYMNNGPQPGNDPVQQRISGGIASTGRIEPGAQFMDSYCDPNFNSVAARGGNLPAMQSCLTAEREKICKQFQDLPPDAQRLLDRAIACMSDTQDAEGAISTKDCSEYDSHRLQLIQKYWQDQNTSYALVFLPEEVAGASGNCLPGRR